MASPKNAMKRLVRTGYVRDQIRFSASVQRRILEESGVNPKKIVVHGEDDRDLKYALSLLRGDEVIETAGGFRPLGSGRYTITGQLEILWETGKVIVDCETGLRSDRDGARMLSEALAKVHGEKLAPSPEEAARRGRNGAKVRWQDKERMAVSEAKPIWLNTKKYRTNKRALKDMPGWTQSEAYRHLGNPGRPVGNPGISKLNRQRRHS